MPDRPLRARGYQDVLVISTPADISAKWKGQKQFFKVKYTREQERYFGAATLTEWLAAKTDPDNFTFIVACERYVQWYFDEYTANEFMEYSYFPPFKIFFSMSRSGKSLPPPLFNLHAKFI